MAHDLNVRIAGRLREMGDLLEHQGEGGFRGREGACARVYARETITPGAA